MKYAIATGMVFMGMIPKETQVAVRTETTGNFSTLSLSDDDSVMIQIVVTPEVKRILKAVIK